MEVGARLNGSIPLAPVQGIMVNAILQAISNVVPHLSSVKTLFPTCCTQWVQGPVLVKGETPLELE